MSGLGQLSSGCKNRNEDCGHRTTDVEGMVTPRRRRKRQGDRTEELKAESQTGSDGLIEPQGYSISANRLRQDSLRWWSFRQAIVMHLIGQKLLHMHLISFAYECNGDRGNHRGLPRGLGWVPCGTQPKPRILRKELSVLLRMLTVPMQPQWRIREPSPRYGINVSKHSTALQSSTKNPIITIHMAFWNQSR